MISRWSGAKRKSIRAMISTTWTSTTAVVAAAAEATRAPNSTRVRSSSTWSFRLSCSSGSYSETTGWVITKFWFKIKLKKFIIIFIFRHWGFGSRIFDNHASTTRTTGALEMSTWRQSITSQSCTLWPVCSFYSLVCCSWRLDVVTYGKWLPQPKKRPPTRITLRTLN